MSQQAKAPTTSAWSESVAKTWCRISARLSLAGGTGLMSLAQRLSAVLISPCRVRQHL